MVDVRRSWRRCRRLLAVFASTALLGAGSLAATPAPASAEPLAAANCAVTIYTQYSPPLTNTEKPTTFTINGQLNNCVAVGDLALRSGTVFSQFTTSSSCSKLLSSGQGSYTIQWNTGESSTVTFNRTVALVLGLIVSNDLGSVAAGKFQGHPYTVTSTTVPDPLACSTTGVSSLISVGDAVIV